jgi:dipeptidyl-peptidase-4
MIIVSFILSQINNIIIFYPKNSILAILELEIMKKLKSIVLIALLLVSSLAIAQQKELSNKLIWASRTFSPEYVYSVNSMNDGEHFTALEDNKIEKYSYKSFGESIETILDGASLSFNNEPLSIDDYSFNGDETMVLLATNVTSIYRRSFTANYFIVDLNTKNVTKLSEKGNEQLADFSPDGQKVGYVQDNNLFYFDITKSEMIQVTTSGERNKIINGATDWVYEEEFELTKGFYWSPDSKNIAYYQYDESDVTEFTMDFYYGKTYPSPYTFKYPKAGEDNSKITIFQYDITSKESINLIETDKKYEYFPRLKWTLDNRLCVLAMNRHQNNLDYVMITNDNTNASLFSNKVVYTDKSETYVEVDNNLIFLKDGNSFLRTSEKDGYRHIYKIGFDGSEVQLTKGEWDVVELKGLNEETGQVYYVSAKEGAIYKALYVTDLKGKKCSKLSELKGANDASFSTGMKYYINYYSNANQPYLITLHNAKGKQLKVLKDNVKLNETIASFNLPKKEFITIKGHDTDLNAWIIKPADFDESKKYPVYFTIYNGPGHNTVADSYDGSNYYYHQLLVQNGYIVISVDTRGTMFRGAEFKKSTYLQLGKLETEDMIACAKTVGGWGFIDEGRIGVQGWSYGGYMTSLCMTKGTDVFKMGIAVAPVTNWRWYDNIYTERFMRTPQENPNGYDDNSPINHVEKMKGKFLIVHGTGDDNVHVQNTFEMSQALVEKNIDFDMAIYTNKNHGIYGGFTRLHLFNKLLKYTLDNL